jgi:hypothetical protein
LLASRANVDQSGDRPQHAIAPPVARRPIFADADGIMGKNVVAGISISAERIAGRA